jgi:nucleotide-binding universal stress UspA family protein
MAMFDKILVPLDGSALAERALEPAVRLVEASDTSLDLERSLVLVHAVVPEMVGEFAWLMREDPVEAQQHESGVYLEAIRAHLAQDGLVVRARVQEGDEASVIVDAAAVEDVDLIVMSSHGRTGILRWMLGSVTEKVLHRAPCPVLVARSARSIHRILVTLDGSPLAETALHPGLALAERLGASVTLLQVNTKPGLAESQPLQYNWSRPAEGGQAESGAMTAAESYLDNLAATQRRAGLTVTAVHVTGNAADSILAFAEANDVDLIAMSTHGRTGLRRWLYGSVTGKVMRSAPCSMLIVRPPSEALR